MDWFWGRINGTIPFAGLGYRLARVDGMAKEMIYRFATELATAETRGQWTDDGGLALGQDEQDQGGGR